MQINDILTDDFFKAVDDFFQANMAKITAGISVAAISSAYFTWMAQLAQSPGHLLKLSCYPLIHAEEWLNALGNDKELEQDVRFHKESWQFLPWRWWAQNFLHFEQWWLQTTTGVSGLPKDVERIVAFGVRQMLDALSPSNFILTNPELLRETINAGGTNLITGTEIAWQDICSRITGTPPSWVENFIPGKTVAATPGRVVYRNHLIELIQYKAQTKQVFKEPIVIFPAWIMKYYILDLSKHNSLVKWLVKQGHTVFIISWRNPTAEDRNLSIDSYYRLGAMAALNAVSKLIPKTKIHLMGYCLGGTLAIITAAAMAREGDKRLRSLTLLAAQGDFTDAGELMLFISASQIAFLKSMMRYQGYLDTKQMAGSFQMLRSYDLIWSKMVDDYMHGKQRGIIDLLAWNADATRMPYKMHSEYLEKLFLHNDLARGRFTIEGNPIAAENIHLPVFVVSTEKDHVAPWQSVYKIHIMIHSNITFVLAGGGHNAGIVSPPGHKKRFYRIYTHRKKEAYINARNWLKVAKKENGSWWLAWQNWLIAQSSGEEVTPPALDASLPAAPGSYVFQK